MRWVAQPRQSEFLSREEDEVLYGGAAGGGKTDALLIDLIAMCTEHPGSNTLLIRRRLNDLKKPGSAIPRSHEMLSGRASWNGSESKWTFRNGSVLQFGHCQHETDVYNYQGAQIDRLAFDELTQFTEFQYRYLKSRVRATQPGVRTGTRAATNPGGVGHAWVKERFIQGRSPETPWSVRESVQTPSGETGERDLSLAYIPARVWDNQALLDRDPDYPVRLASLGDSLSRALLEGDWDQFEGQYFTEWRREVHVVEPFPIPPQWARYRAVDYGYSSPFCCLWLAHAPSGEIVVYREVYGTKRLDRDQALMIKARSAGETFRGSFGDPSMWSAQHNGYEVQAPAGSYAEMGVPLTRAHNDRRVGWQRLREVLAWQSDPRIHPRLRVFATCVNLIRTLPALIHDERDPEDVDTEGEDHAADALRYGLLGMEIPLPRKTKVRFGQR